LERWTKVLTYYVLGVREALSKSAPSKNLYFLHSSSSVRRVVKKVSISAWTKVLASILAANLETIES